VSGNANSRSWKLNSLYLSSTGPDPQLSPDSQLSPDEGDGPGAGPGGDSLGVDPLGGDPLGGDPLGGEPLGGEPLGGEPLGGETLGGDPLGGDPLGGDPLGDSDSCHLACTSTNKREAKLSICTEKGVRWILVVIEFYKAFFCFWTRAVKNSSHFSCLSRTTKLLKQKHRSSTLYFKAIRSHSPGKPLRCERKYLPADTSAAPSCWKGDSGSCSSPSIAK
jgi:hypothetical protein